MPQQHEEEERQNKESCIEETIFKCLNQNKSSMASIHKLLHIRTNDELWGIFRLVQSSPLHSFMMSIPKSVTIYRLQQTCIYHIISSSLGDKIPLFPIVIDMNQFNY